jgi:hypothetical protein
VGIWSICDTPAGPFWSPPSRRGAFFWWPVTPSGSFRPWWLRWTARTAPFAAQKGVNDPERGFPPQILGPRRRCWRRKRCRRPKSGSHADNEGSYADNEDAGGQGRRLCPQNMRPETNAIGARAQFGDGPPPSGRQKGSTSLSRSPLELAVTLIQLFAMGVTGSLRPMPGTSGAPGGATGIRIC